MNAMPVFVTLTTFAGDPVDVNTSHITRMLRHGGDTPSTSVWTLDGGLVAVQQTPDDIKTLVREAYAALDTY